MLPLSMRWATLTCLILAAAGSELRAAATNGPAPWAVFPWSVTSTGTPVLVDCLALLATNEWSLALTKVEAQLVDHPQDAGALHLSGLLFWYSGNREEATRRLIKATRAPNAQAITLWTLAALSEQAHSQAEAVGWIKRASRGASPEEVEQWLRKPYFASLCEFQPYREMLAALDLSSLCPSRDLRRFNERADRPEDSTRELLGKEGPQSSLRLPVQDAKSPQPPVESDAKLDLSKP